jgi:hypothetical protein
MMADLNSEFIRLRERAGEAEAEAKRCEERCNKCVRDLAEATKRIAVLEKGLLA